jgi:hypothetical protein
MASLFESIQQRLNKTKSPPAALTQVTSRVDDSPGWQATAQRPHDYDPGTVLEIYQDSLQAWRKNPIAWRIIAITTDYTVGGGIKVSSPLRSLNKFIQEFWHHEKNRMHLRLESMSDELARAGDLFILLFRNPQDGMSYIRLVTKDRIQSIETAPNDWETELAFYETQEAGETRKWLAPEHPEAPYQEAVMLHYAVNRPAGALLGESDLTTLIPWLLRYSRMLEDRVRLNWALRAFLWVVTVPANKVKEKQEQYRHSPEAGSIIIKDEGERWEVYAPSLHAADASNDLRAVRQMIDAGAGYPPHWRGEAADANLATATAMQAPTERHLMRRQQYFSFMLQDILYHAYQRAVEIGLQRRLPSLDYSRLFSVGMPDIARADNEALARSARDIAAGLTSLSMALGSLPPGLQREMLRLCFTFAGKPLDEEALEEMLRELEEKESKR